MDEYFTSTLTKLNTINYRELTIVLGNESCDLDSAVSSIVYAVFLNWQHNQMQCKVCTREHRPKSYKEDIYVPMLNVDRDDYELKTEVAFMLRKYGIYESNLTFRDDHNLKDLLASTAEKTKIVLVDHHTLAKKDQFLAPLVTEIIDHRPLDKSQWMYKDDTRLTIETVGSCCSLVTKRIKDLSALFAKDVDFFNAYPICSNMLHETIILDTVNFSKEVNKATPLDEEMILFLESLIKPDDYIVHRQKVLDNLVKARGDVSHLTAAQLLKKDVKLVNDILVPSFPLLVKDFLSMPDALQAVDEALNRRGCSIAVLLGMDLSEGLKRDTAVYSMRNPVVASKLTKHLETWNRPVLDLVQEQISSAVVYYIQNNLSASRKQYMPALSEFIPNS